MSIIDYSILIGEIEEESTELKERLNTDLKQMKNFVFFTGNANKPYFVGVIDPLTGFT